MDPGTAELGSHDEVIPFDVALLLAEADHRIANHLALLMGYVRLKSADVDRLGEPPSLDSVHVLLDGVGAQIAAVARLHRALVADDPAGVADLGAHLREVCAPFASGLGGAARIVEDLPPGCVVRSEQVLPLSQIAAEVITNALKHACHGAQPGTVLVRCRSDAGGEVRLEIIDSGDGFPPAFDPETDGGLGFRLVRSLSQKLGARIAFESTPAGVRFRLSLPATASAARGIQVPDEQLCS
jgi:two-component sensor histidine kinase